MKNPIEQNTSGSERNFAVIPEEQASERSVPSEWSVPGRPGAVITYSREHFKYSYRMRSTRSFDLGFQRTEEGY
jgi:hypothetical protein